MGWETFFCLAVMALVFAGLVRNVAPDALLLGALVLVTLVGIITPEQALSGFSNPGVLTIGALYVVAAAMRETGGLNRAGSWVLGKANSERGALLRMAGLLPAMSAFLNNTPIVAMFIPIVSDWCRKHQVSASRLLIPLSYLCIFGGTCTLIGTSTNLVINGLLEQTSQSSPGPNAALQPLGFFELGRVGLMYAIVGTLYLLLIGRWLLPRRKGLIEEFTDSSREYLVNMRVEPECRLVGKSIQQAGLRQLPGLFLIEINRDGQIITPVSPEQTLQSNDILTFTGVISTIVDLEKIPGLIPIADEGYITKAIDRRGGVLCEAVVSPACPSVGKTIRDADFRALYNAAVMAVHRGGERLTGKVGDMVLKPGDTLLLQAGPHFMRANRNNPHFLLVGGVEDYRPVRYDKTVWSLILLVLLVVLMSTGVMRVVTAVLLVAGLMVASRCISISDARRSVDWQTLLAIAAAFGLAQALVNSGLVGSTAGIFVKLSVGWGPYAVLAGVYVLTTLFTSVITNNAAAALVFPFAVAIGTQIGASPRPFVMAVAFAASASFVTPLGYQTNLMVYGPGGYRVSDFVRAGLPLTLLLLVCATLLIPLAWPFYP